MGLFSFCLWKQRAYYAILSQIIVQKAVKLRRKADGSCADDRDRIMIKNKSDIAALAASVTAALCFAAMVLLWLLLPGEGGIAFDMPGGDSVSVEYGTEYSHDVKAYARIPLVNRELYIEAVPSDNVDTLRLGSSEIVYTASFLGRKSSISRTVTVVDTQPPQILLETRPDYQADWLEGYVEEGYTAFDACDGDLTEKVETQRLDGLIKYTVTDSSGNSAAAERPISYVKNLPSLSLKGAEHEVISARPSYADPGFTALSADGSDLSAFVKVKGQVESRSAGDYELCYCLENRLGDSVSVSRSVTVQMESCPEPAQPGEKTIYLTFDDGPGPYTRQLLYLLDHYGVKATFFVTGTNPAYKDCIGEAYRAGHAVGVHSYSHNYGYIYSSEENFFNDFNAAQQLIYEQTGAYSQLFRFPGGSSNTVSRFNNGIITRISQSLEAMGYRYFDWDVNSADAEYARSASAVAANVINGCARRSCSVVLQHDIKAFSVNAVEQIILWGLENGYSFRPLELSSPCAHHGIAN